MPRIAAVSVRSHTEMVRDRIFAAFDELMSQSSFESITMAQIAERAGIKRTAIYHHFRDTEAIVVDYASHQTATYLDGLASDLATSHDPADKIRIYIRHQLEAGKQFHTGMGALQYHLLSETAIHQIREHVLAIEALLESILTEGVDQGVFTVTNFRATMSIMHATMTSKGVTSDQLEEFILTGLGVTQDR